MDTAADPRARLMQWELRLRSDAPFLTVLAAYAVFVCRLALSLVLVPPWQQPDEPAQVAFAEVSRDRLSSLGSPDPGRQAEILQSMETYEWWRHYRMPTPTPLPTRFDVGGGAAYTLGVDPTSASYPRTYYSLIADLLSRAPPMSVVKDLYVMRTCSAVLAVLTLWAAWHGARQCLGEAGGATVMVILTLHPQFVMVSTTASPDALVNLLGAGIWWQALVATRRASFLLPLAGVWLAAIVAAAADRMGAPLLLMAFVVSVIALTRQRGFKRSAAALAIFATALLGTSLWLRDVFWLMFRSAAWTRLLPVPDARSWEYFFRFTSVSFESWWSSLGWVRYSPPTWWMGIVVVLAVGVVLGVVQRLFRDRDTPMREVLGLAMMMLAIQIAGVYWAYFRFGDTPQGRHLFPCLVPALVLLWLGVEAWMPMRYRQYAAIGLVVVFALLDSPCGDLSRFRCTQLDRIDDLLKDVQHTQRKLGLAA